MLLSPIETQQNVWFPGVFRRYKMGKLASCSRGYLTFHSKINISMAIFFYFVPHVSKKTSGFQEGVSMVYSIIKINKEELRTCNFRRYWRRSIWKFQGPIKKEVEFQGLLKKSIGLGFQLWNLQGMPHNFTKFPWVHE